MPTPTGRWLVPACRADHAERNCDNNRHNCCCYGQFERRRERRENAVTRRCPCGERGPHVTERESDKVVEVLLVKWLVETEFRSHLLSGRLADVRRKQYVFRLPWSDKSQAKDDGDDTPDDEDTLQAPPKQKAGEGHRLRLGNLGGVDALVAACIPVDPI